jgi:CspA family cold shock protein
MATGEVKWFNNAKGWGFIVPAGGGEDIFVHFSAIESLGYKTLIPGQKVNYNLEKGDRGLHASNVIAHIEEYEEQLA